MKRLTAASNQLAKAPWAPAWTGLVLAGLLLAGCSGEDGGAAPGQAGDPARGRRVIERYGCGACHTIPGIDGARARVGPALSGMATRTQLAGDLPNTPENLVRWIRQPQAIKPGNVMPDLGIAERDARHVAAYLYTLR
ncbi:MAG TPA: c-type cytochrome [Vicinamibacterales bacterium]|nr:c-type cytochrome [Vicinamibacterales bacterium]